MKNIRYTYTVSAIVVAPLIVTLAVENPTLCMPHLQEQPQNTEVNYNVTSTVTAIVTGAYFGDFGPSFLLK